jgi:organic radical activating enzyme
MSKLILPFLETMITQACNLSCQGCTNYSDIKHSGYVTWKQGQAWLEPWTDRFEIQDFGIMGGEPLINPEVEKWLIGVRDLLPDAQIRFTTNGLLMHRWPDLLSLCHDMGNVVFKITVHVKNQIIDNAIEKIFSQFDWEPVIEHGISRWSTSNGLRFQINQPEYFLKTYQNTYHDMMPHHSDPEEAFGVCIQKTCPLLYQGKIYKCSTAGLLLDTLARFGKPNWTHWQPYIDPGISPDSSQDELQAFVDNFGLPNPRCGQCPDKSTPPLLHQITVRYK